MTAPDFLSLEHSAAAIILVSIKIKLFSPILTVSRLCSDNRTVDIVVRLTKITDKHFAVHFYI